MKDVIIKKEAEQASQEEMRGKILQLESALMSMPQIEIPIEHHFAPGIYMRQMTMPMGSVVTGKIHKTEHMCVLSKGTVTVVTDTETRTLTAPAIVHSMPGVKRALHALSDVVWVNVHHNPTNEKDEDKIDDLFVVDTFDQFLEFTEKKQIQGGV